MKNIPEPDMSIQYWLLQSNNSTFRICIVHRTAFNLYYTGVEKFNVELDSWELVKRTSDGHGENKDEAMARIKKLLETYNTFS